MPPHPRSVPRASARAGFRRKKRSDYRIRSVANALELLDTLAGESDEMGVSALARRLGLHKNNVFRLLATLQTRGYVEQNPETENYRLGLSTLALARGFLQQTRLLRQARGVLEEIAHRAGETAHVGVRRGDEVVYLDGVEPDRMLRVAARPGLARPLHASAEGKILAAFDPSGSGFDPDRWEGKTPAVDGSGDRVDPVRLVEEMKEIAARGWAWERETCESGIACVAAPVRDHTGRVAAALSVAGPAARLDAPDMAEEFIHLAQDAAARLSARLGFRKPEPPADA
jgi:IclR family KDG regulon transcriptional repressor